MRNTLLVPEIRECLENEEFNTLEEFCRTGHPQDTADFLSSLTPPEISKVLMCAQPQPRTEIFSHLDVDIQSELALILKRDELALLISHMAPDDRVDLLKRIPEGKQDAIMPAIAQAEREDIRRLSSYPEGTAGAIMTSDYATLLPHITAAEAIAKLRLEAPDKETIYYAYVVDEDRKLIGFVSLKDLILARPEYMVRDIMSQKIIFAFVSEDQEEAARKIAKYDLIALPVVTKNKILVGIITHDDAFDVINQEYTEDLEKLMAISGTHEAGAYLRKSSWEHFKSRFGWIVALAALGLVSGLIVQKFEGLLIQLSILATFMPMLADTGGNTGSQSATLMVRALGMKEILTRDVFRVLAKELKVSLLLGLVLGVLSLGRVFLMVGKSTQTAGHSLLMIGLAVAAALGLQVITATLIGAFLPFAATKLKFDPAVVASPALTTIVDITGLLIFFVTVKTILGL